MVPPLIALQDVVHASLWQLANPKDHKCPIIGQTWLNEKVAQIKARAAEIEQRKPPMAIVSVSRGGKTRALLELTKELRSQGIVAIYVSFNDYTQFLPSWTNRSIHYLRNELLRRITYELQIQQQQLQFHKCGWDERLSEVIESYQGCVVLLIDELNNAIPQTADENVPEFYETQQMELWNFIKQYFLVKNRLLIFSAHENQAVDCAARNFIRMSNSLRKVTVERVPVITTQEEVKIITRIVGCTLSTLVCSGFLPAHVIDYEVHCFSRVDPITSPVKAFAKACLLGELLGEGNGLSYNVRRRSIYFKEPVEQPVVTPPECEGEQPPAVDSTEMSSQSNSQPCSGKDRFYWTPLWIARLLLHHTQTDGHFTHLQKAITDKTSHKSDAWEFLIALALILRRLTRTCGFMTNHNCLVESLGFYRPEEHIENVGGLRQWLESEVSKEDLAGLKHVVLLPKSPRFQQYDVLEAHLMEDNTWKLISGYQAKSGEESPDCDAEIQGASWWLSLDAPNRRNKPTVRGFVNLNDDEVEEFLGFSLWECAKHLKEFRNGKLHI